MEQNTLRRNIQKIYWYRVLQGMMFPVPTIVLFWQQHGMSLTLVMVLQSLFALTMVVLELPSGYLADVVGRRKTLILAACSTFMAIVIYSLGQHFFHFLAAEIFFAFGFAMISGADEAFIYDTLQALDETDRYQEVYGKLFFYNVCAVGVSSVVGGWLASFFSFRLTFYAVYPFFLSAIVIAFSLEEPPRKTLQAQQGYLRELRNILRYCLVQNTRLRWLMLYSGLVMGINQAAVWLYQPYFQVCGLKVVYFGLAFASFQIVAALSSKYAYHVERWLGARYALIILVILTASGYFLMAYVVFLLSFMFAFTQQFARGFSRVVISEYINQLTESDIRATVLSTQNLIMRLCYAMLIPIAGKIADLTSLLHAMKILGAATVLIGGGMLLILHKQKAL